MPKFCVPVVYTGLSNFVVTAKNKEAAVEAALVKFTNDEAPERIGNEYESIDHYGDVEKVPPVKKVKAKKPSKNQMLCQDCKAVGTKAEFRREAGCSRCPDCNSIEVIPLKIAGLCRVCFEPTEQCFSHCHDRDSKDSKHVPDLRFIRTADGAGEGVIDVSCKVCGVSGSMRIDPKDIIFE